MPCQSKACQAYPFTLRFLTQFSVRLTGFLAPNVALWHPPLGNFLSIHCVVRHMCKSSLFHTIAFIGTVLIQIQTKVNTDQRRQQRSKPMNAANWFG